MVIVRVEVAPWFFEWAATRARRGLPCLLKDDAFVRFMCRLATETRPAPTITGVLHWGKRK